MTDRYVCSQNLINFVKDLLTQNPNLVEEIKLENKKVELTPGAKDSWYTNVYLLPFGNPAFFLHKLTLVKYIIQFLLKYCK